MKLDGLYPPKGIDNNVILSRLNMLSLEKRTNISSVMFLYKLVNGKIVCPSLLGELWFNVPRIECRFSNYFYLRVANTNIMFVSRIYRIFST